MPCEIFTWISPYPIIEGRQNISDLIVSSQRRNRALNKYGAEYEHRVLNKYGAEYEQMRNGGRISQQVPQSWHKNCLG